MEDMKEQARMSGLVLGNNNQDEVQWNIKEYELGPRLDYESVVVHAPYDKKEDIIVVLGGLIPIRLYSEVTKTVSLLNTDGSKYEQCPNGPSMNERRAGLAAVVCNGFVYAIGGWSRDSIERIQVSDLLSSANLNKTEKETPWKTLKCRLSTEDSCLAAVVQNRYIVIGGADRYGNVDILDVSQTSQPFIFQGPSMNVPRIDFGMAAIGSRVYAIGGCKFLREETEFTSVEYLDLLTDSYNNGRDFEEPTLVSLSWKMHKGLVLPIPRVEHSVGPSLVVLGGRNGHDRVRSVEVFDTKRNKVWSLPELREARGLDVKAVAVFNGIVVLGGDLASWKTFEMLPLMDKNSAVFKCLLDGSSLREFG